MDRRKKRVCVIGAGSSGLVAIKELLDEGQDVVCFEKYDEVGGNFYCSNNVDKSGAYDSALLTISNYMMAYSSFPPPPEDQRKFWTALEYQQYLKEFSQYFDLEETIQYNSVVTSVKKTDKGHYAVEVQSRESEGHKNTYSFDAIAVCTGSSRIPKYIEIEGMKSFKGDIYHSAYYKNAKEYEGQRVLCIGMGETGVDVVNELAQYAQSCTLSVRQFQPIIQRYPFGGIHTSDAYTSHALYAAPSEARNARMKLAFKMIKHFSKDKEEQAYADWNLKAGHYVSGFNIKSEVFVKRIVDKTLSINSSGIDSLGENYVLFKDGQKEYIDAIMLNTGYMDQFGFIKGVDITDIRQLYRHMIHPVFREDIVFIGWARPAVGGVPACSEMQSRYFALLCSGKKVLPDDWALRKQIKQQAHYEDEVHYRNPSVRSLVDYSGYMHDFSKVIGCSPWRIASLFNPKLLYRLWFGSQMPIIYRLYGPHSNFEQAKKCIFNVPVALPFAEMVLMTIYTPITIILAALHLIKQDPKY